MLEKNVNLPTRRRVPGPRAESSKTSPDQPPSAPKRWWLELAVIPALVVAGFAVWWSLSSVDEDEVLSLPGGPGQIAIINTPDVHALLINPADSDHLYFGGHFGILESRDGGFTWRAGQLTNADAMGLSISPNQVRMMFAVGHNVAQVSLDQGKNWKALEHDLPDTDIHAIVQDPNDADRLYADLPRAGLFTSGDAGARWMRLPSQPPGGPAFALSMSGSQLFAATEDGIAVTSDQGATWEPLASQPTGVVMSLAITMADPLVIYAGTSSGLFKSVDGGASWMRSAPDATPVLALAVDQSDPRRVLFVTKGGGV